MASIETDKPKTIVVSKNLLYFFAFLVVAQLGLFALGFYKNLNPQTSVEYVDRHIIVDSPQKTVVSAGQKKLDISDFRPLPDLPPLPRGFGRSQQPLIPSNNAGFRFDPAVNDPLEQRLLKEARAARVKSDMRVTALKLSEVLTKFPDSVHAQHQLADMYESMGIFDKAIEHYEAVFMKGLAQAGPLYEVAAKKLKEGFYTERVFGELMAIGTIHQFQDPNVTTGQAITITIPILAAPELAVDADQVAIDVKLFDKQGNQVERALNSNKPEYSWSRDVRDWTVNGEEFLIVNYYLPNEGENSLFESLGPRKYYGYVIELSYAGEMLDQVAWPRILANKITGQSGNDLFDFSFEDTYNDINEEHLLLPNPLNN